MPARKTCRTKSSSSVPMKNVIAAVVSGIGKRKKITKKRKFGQSPVYDDSCDSDYVDDEPEIKRKRTKILNDKSTKKSPKLSPRSKKSNEPTSKKRKRLFIHSSSDEENEPCNEASTSKSTRRRDNVKQKAKNLLPIAQHRPSSKNVHFEDPALNVDDRKHIEYLKRPSLKRFRTSSSSSDIENLSVNTQNDVKTKSTKIVDKSESEPYSGENLWGNKIPTEILTRIFRFSLMSENGAVPFLLRIRQVCRHWCKVAEDPTIWTSLDLDYKKIKDKDFALEYLPNFLSSTKYLSLARWEKLKNDELDVLLGNNAKCIIDLDVSFCSMLKPKLLLENTLPKFCPDLQSLNLSYISTRTSLSTSLYTYLNGNGSNLRRLYLNGNTVNRFNTFFETFKLSNCMRSLQILDISRLVCETVSPTNILDFVKAFPNLTHLRMSDAVINFSLPNPEELEITDKIWPNLIEVEFAVSHQDWWGFFNVMDCLMKCLKKCSSLRRLNIPGHKITTNLDLLANTPLTHLNISRTSGITPTLGQTMQKWATSLEILDVSWIKVGRYSILPEMTPADHHAPPLLRLNVAGTPVTAERLITIIAACPNLEQLDCTACRLLPLGMKREYVGDEIRSLGAKLRSSV